MLNEAFLQKFDEDDGFISYHPANSIKIFGFELDNSECEILVSSNINLSDILPILSEYLEWLSSCKHEIMEYFSSKVEERLPEDWFDTIEIYNASITFISSEDFGATVSFGESIFPDHIIEYNIDKFEIIEDGLVG